MSYQPAVDDYVTARAKNGDHLTGTVSTLYPGDGEDFVEVGCGGVSWILRPEDGWTFELTERPQPPLADGVYQKGNALMFRRYAIWLFPFSATQCSLETDHVDSHYIEHGWQYVGPEVSW